MEKGEGGENLAELKEKDRFVSSLGFGCQRVERSKFLINKNGFWDIIIESD